MVTSSSCSGTCLTLSMPRQPKVSAAESGARPRRARGAEASALLKGDVVGDHAASSVRVVVVVLGRVAGEGQEHLVEARLAERELARSCTPSAASSATASAAPVRRRRTARTAPPGRPRGGRCRARRPAARSASSALLGVEQPHVQRAAADRGLELRGRALAITRPWSITAMPSASWSASSRYCVQSRIVVPAARERADDVPHLVARARVEAGRRLVEEHQLGRHDEAGRDVEPAAHAAGVVLDQPAGGVGEVERLEQLGRARLRVGAAQAEQPAEQDQVLAAGEVLVDRGHLAGQADEAAHRVGLARRCRGRAPGRCRASGRSRVASMRIVVVLPAPLGPSTP